MNTFGVWTREQLIADGIPGPTIDSRTRRGQYTRLLPRIYCITEPTKYAHCFAVTLWQPKAKLSHRTAAWLYSWLDEPARIEATVPRDVRMRPPNWLRLYRRDIDPAEVGEVASMPTVCREQALLDCIAVMEGDEIDRLVDDRCAHAISPESLRLLGKKSAGRWGNRQLARQLRHMALGAASEPERLLAREFNRRNFPLAANAQVGPYFGDFVDERARVIVEIDGREFHSDPEVFRNDRRRQNWLVRHGWLVLRYSAYDVLADPARVADEVMAVVRQRRKARS